MVFDWGVKSLLIRSLELKSKAFFASVQKQNQTFLLPQLRGFVNINMPSIFCLQSKKVSFLNAKMLFRGIKTSVFRIEKSISEKVKNKSPFW